MDGTAITLDTLVEEAGLPRPVITAYSSPSPQVGRLGKVHYTHDAMIDLIIERPFLSQNDLAAHFGYTPGWVSQIIASDAFQSKLAKRREEIIDPAIRATIEERIKALVIQSIEVLKRKLEGTGTGNVTDKLALGVMEASTRALGYGARGPLVQNNTQFVVQVPAKSSDPAAWEKSYGSQRAEKPAAHKPVTLDGSSEREVGLAAGAAESSPVPAVATKEASHAGVPGPIVDAQHA